MPGRTRAARRPSRHAPTRRRNAGSRGKIDSWHERIVLPWIDFEGFNPFPDDDEGGIDIPIERLG